MNSYHDILFEFGVNCNELILTFSNSSSDFVGRSQHRIQMAVWVIYQLLVTVIHVNTQYATKNQASNEIIIVSLI